jgi:hypothetical protein
VSNWAEIEVDAALPLAVPTLESDDAQVLRWPGYRRFAEQGIVATAAAFLQPYGNVDLAEVFDWDRCARAGAGTGTLDGPPLQGANGHREHCYGGGESE